MFNTFIDVPDKVRALFSFHNFEMSYPCYVMLMCCGFFDIYQVSNSFSLPTAAFRLGEAETTSAEGSKVRVQSGRSQTEQDSGFYVEALSFVSSIASSNPIFSLPISF